MHETSKAKLEELRARYGPIRSTHEIDFIRGKIDQEHWHVYVAGLMVSGDGDTLDQAITEVMRDADKIQDSAA